MTQNAADTIIKKLEEIALPVVTGEGLDLYDVEYKREQTGWVVRFYLIGKEGRGVRVDDCARISRQLNLLMDVEDVIPHAYNLEVSSPGLVRTLKKLTHFEKSIGEIVKIKTIREIDGQRFFKGRLDAVNGTDIIINAGNITMTIPFDNISHAKVELEI